VQGEPKKFLLTVPNGWEVTGATGSTLESSEMEGGALALSVSGAARSHAFLVTMERSIDAAKAEVRPVSFPAAQRETGELVVEGEGTMELRATEAGGVKRMDAKEAAPTLRSMTQKSLQAAFRYHRQTGEAPSLQLEWTRYPETRLLSAVAQGATVTTLVTSEGRSMTEVKLSVRNREQPFLKLSLRPGESVVSAEVAGEGVKPVQGSDGSRVPLLRPGFRPTDIYPVSFVIMHSGTPFACKGGAELTLPKMDVPVGLMEWEVFLPQRYKVKDFAGDALNAALFPQAPQFERAEQFARLQSSGGISADTRAGVMVPKGGVAGYVLDQQSAVVPNASIAVTNEASGTVMQAKTDANGRWVVPYVPPGRLRINTELTGFMRETQYIEHTIERSSVIATTLRVGAAADSVVVTAQVAPLQAETSQSLSVNGRNYMALARLTPGVSNNNGGSNSGRANQKQIALQNSQASENVANLRNRVSGVLPVPVEVPKAGSSYRFTRPLVVDEETKVTFTYRDGR
jgi:hypothetical protein